MSVVIKLTNEVRMHELSDEVSEVASPWPKDPRLASPTQASNASATFIDVTISYPRDFVRIAAENWFPPRIFRSEEQLNREANTLGYAEATTYYCCAIGSNS